MVVHTSDSTNTLVSLENGLKVVPALHQQHREEEIILEPTQLLVERSSSISFDDDSLESTSSSGVDCHQPLYLPRRRRQCNSSNLNLDEYPPPGPPRIG